ncbi:hypothetical protein GCM10027053_08200 [Intrasporangium mesophilum]
MFGRHTGARTAWAAVTATVLALTFGVPGASGGTPLGGMMESTLPGIAPTSPKELGEATTTDLLYANPTEGMAQVDVPEANSSGTAETSYPLVLPQGRGFTPKLALSYSSEGGSSWTGLGWDLAPPEIAVDTSFGAPRFCDGSVKSPPCGNVESESYTLDGDALMPNAAKAVLDPRIAERQDFTRRVETDYEQIIRHGTKPDNYFWEVRDKQGNIRWYGGVPDAGGPNGEAGQLKGINDRTRDASGILTDGAGNAGNGVRWFLTATRDIGVNMHRYEYVTVTYKRDETQPTGWKALGGNESCPSGQACPKHIYLSKILYTAASTASEEPEDPAYEVRFVRTPGGRTDAVLDGTGGVLDLDQDLLDHIDVVYRKTGEIVTRYQLTYDADPHFGKSRLRKITQIGCHGLAACPTTGLDHTFDYYDDIATAKSGFDTEARWETGANPTSPGGTPDYITNNLSGLGSSATNAGDGHIYIGFNPAAPNKTGSAGGSFSMNGSTGESVIEFMDLNGDGLPDKVYRKTTNLTQEPGTDEKMIRYQLNTTTPGTARRATVTFGEMHELDGFQRLPIQRSIGIAGGPEAYFGVYGVFNIGGSWSWVDSYFTDANGDGLPDLVKGNSVLFNHLECTPGKTGVEACLPHFDSSSAQTRVPLASQTVPVSDPAFADMVDRLRDAIPPVDTVRRWTAPFSGTVSVDASATLTPGDDAPGSARLAIQRTNTAFATATVTKASPTWSPDTLSIPVVKGQSIYFRAGSRDKGNGDVVTWQATITYAGGSVPDANGLNQRAYSLGDDFTLAGRPDLFSGVGNGGTASFSTALHKTKATTDDLVPQLLVRSASNTISQATMTVTPITSGGAVDQPRVKTVTQNGAQWCVADQSTSFGCFATQALANQRVRTIGEDETGYFSITASPTFAAPVVDSKGVVTALDAVSARLAVDTPIDLTAITWTKAARLCFVVSGECDATKTDISPHMDIDVYPRNSLTAPATAWTSDLGRTVTPHLNASLGSDNPGGEIVVTAKTAAGMYYKARFTVGSGSQTINRDLPDISLANGTKYWFDVTIRNAGVSANISNTNLLVTWTDSSVAKSEDVPETLNWAGSQGFFPIPYRGWGAAGYTAKGAKATQNIDESAFIDTAANGKPFDNKNDACQALYGGACPSDTSVNDTGFGNYPPGSGTPPPVDTDKMTEQVPDAFAFRPILDPTTLEQRWEGPRAKIFAADAGRTGSSRPGDDLPLTGPASAGTISAPNLLGETGPIFMLMAGIGPLGGSFAAGWSRSLVDFMDMNGDGFPDTVRPDSITYTNPRGTQECGPANARVACTGGGVDTVNTATTIGVSGSFGGSPITVSGNYKGTTNSTKGGSAGKSNGGSDTEYGANIGGSIGGGASFTNPTTQNEHQDDDALKKVPRDETIPVQQTIADINGDGLPDRIKVDADEIRVRLNLGHSFTPEFRWTVSAFSSTNSYSGSIGASFGFNIDNGGFSGGIAKNSNVDLPEVSWDDINGDGLLDAVYRSGGDVKIAFSNGTGLTDQQVYGTHQKSTYKVVGIFDSQEASQIRQDSSESLGGGADVTVGIPLCAVACYLILNPGGHFENSMTATDIDLTDVNGDGYADTVSRVKSSSDIKVALNTQGRTNLLEKVTTPMRGTFTLDYHRDGNTTSHPESQWVMDDVKVSSSRGADGTAERHTTISYGSNPTDFIQRTDRGYDKVTVTEHYTAWDHTDVNTPVKTDTVRTTVHKYHNASVWESGLEYETTLYDGDESTGKTMQRTRTTWSLYDLDQDAPSGGGYAALDLSGRTIEQLLATRATPEVSKVQQDWYTGGVLSQTTTMTYAYDRLGNPVTVVDSGLPGTTDDDTIATIEYARCTTSASDDLNTFFGCGADLHETPTAVSPYWDATNCQTWDSQPVAITVKDPNGKVLRSRQGHTAYCDNNSVTVQRELLTPASGADPAVYAETLLTYDSWGSYDRIVMPPDADGNRYAVKYVYDDKNHANVADVTDFELQGSGDPDGTDPADTARDFIEDDVLPTGNARGNESSAVFDGPTGRVASRTDANGNTTTYTYDAFSRVKTVTSPDNGVATYDYHPDDASYPFATVKHSDEFNPGTTIDTATYVDGSGRITGRKRDAVVYDPVANTTGQGFAAEGRSDVDGLGRTVHQWKPFLQTGKTLADYPVDPTDPKYDRATITTFDALDRVTSERRSDGATTATAYGFESLPPYGVVRTSDETDPQGRHTKSWLDAHDNILLSEDRTKDGVAQRTTYLYDRIGQLLTVSSPGNLTTTHTYDLLGRRTSTMTPDGGLVQWTYDLAGNKTSEQSPVLRESNGVHTVFGYDFGLLTSITYPDEAPITLDYGGYLGHSSAGNGAGRLVHVVDKARNQTFAYDVNGRLAKDVTTMTGPHPNKGPFTTDYDNDWLGRLATVSLPDGEVVRNDYDAGGRLDRVVGLKDCTALGTLTSAIDATQTTITVTEPPHADPASAFNPTLPFTIKVDGEQMRVTARVPGAVAGTFDYTVDRGINGTLLTPTAAAHTAGAAVTADVAVPCLYKYLDDQEYDVYGQTALRKNGNGVVNTTFRDEDTRRLTRQLAMSPDGTRELQDQRYWYDLVGNVKKTVNDLPEDLPSLFGGPTVQNFTYDGRYRLTAADGTWDYAPKTTRKFTWSASLDDATSKVTRMTQRDWTIVTGCTTKCKEVVQPATTFDRTAYTYDPGKPHQATSVLDSVTKKTEKYEYDSDGEQTRVTNPDMIRDLTWDWAGKLTEIVDHNPKGTGRKQTDYVYDYAGQLATEIKEQGVTYYVNPWVTVRNGTMSKNIWAGNDRLAVQFAEDGNKYETRQYWLHKDLQGSTNIVTGLDGKVFQHQEYFPTGQVWIKEDSTIFRTPWQYAGGYTDEDHRIINFGDRWYSTDQARFLTVDPILTDDPLALVQNPAQTSVYSYAQSNPSSNVDTDGRASKSANLDALDVLRTIQSLKPDGDPITQAQTTKLLKFFAKNGDTAIGRQGLGWLKNYNTYQHRQAKIFDRLDARPLLEFEIEDGKLKQVKLGFAIGKRAVIYKAEDKGAGATPQPSKPVQDNQADTTGTAQTSAAKANGVGGTGKADGGSASPPSTSTGGSNGASVSTGGGSGTTATTGQAPSQPAQVAGAQTVSSEGATK